MKPVDQKIPRKSLFFALIFSACCLFIFSGYTLLTEYAVDEKTAMQLVFFVLLFFLLSGLLLIVLYLIARKEKNVMFSQSVILRAGLILIFLVLGIRFQIARKILEFILNFI